VTRLVLYKHGVAFVGRRGPIDGDFTLTVRRDDMKDVLKSLFVDVGARDSADPPLLGAVTFDTPADAHEEAAARDLPGHPGAALVGLLDGLRGRSVELDCGDRRRRGAVIGVDDAGDGRRQLVLRTDADEISLVDLAAVERLTVVEAPSRDDLSYRIERLRGATGGQHREVTVAVRGRAEDARVSYLVAAPMWRVSYRLIRDASSLAVVAMGIIHNPLDEDLTEVEVTLTTGQPLSFDVDLYSARRVRRTVREERDRVAAPQGARAMVSAAMRSAGPGDAESAAGYAAAAADVDTDERGEYFHYRLATPVSLKRGGAATVPLAVAPVADVRRELVWRPGGGPAPEVVLAFTNTTGVVLEEGPAVVYEQGGYAGEAMVEFTARGAALRCAFAKDLAVRCETTPTWHTVTTRVRLATEAIVEEQRVECRHRLRADSQHDDPVEVVFELPRTDGHRFVGGGQARDGGADARWQRFAVTVPGGRSVTAEVVETWPVYTEIDYEDLAPGRLESWLAGRALDAETAAALSGVLAHWERATRLDGQHERAVSARAELYDAQSRLTEQLQVLGTDDDEGRLRARQVAELAALQDRVGDLDAEVHRLRADAAAARSAAAGELHRLVS